jgi:glycosyltransferase involved in cell wall biosynthesis
MPNVVYINAALGYGATGRIVEQTGLLAERHGYNCCVVHSARYGRDSKLEHIATGSIRDERIHAIKSFLFDAQGFGSKLGTKRMIEYIDALKPNIIHIHNLHAYYLNYPLLFKYINNNHIPVVWTLHDCWPFTGHCMYFDYVDCNKWQTECHDCPLKSSYPRSLIDKSTRNFRLKKSLFSRIDNLTLVPVSNWLGGLCKQSFLKDKFIKVIHNGIDLNIFRPSVSDARERYDISPNQFVVLGVANHFGTRKGLAEFVEIHNKIAEIKVVLVGASEQEQKTLPQGIICIGRTESQKELADIYSMADVFVNPTYEDNFPTTNLEALACGTPVITYQTGGSPEAIDIKTGLVVLKGDKISLISAILDIKSKGKAYYSEHCRIRAERKYNKDERFMDYIKLYDEILQ